MCAYLKKNANTESGGKNDDVDDVEQLFAPQRQQLSVGVDVEIAFIVSPLAHRVPLYFTVPHQIMCGSICLITPTPQRAFKDKVQALVDNGDAVATRVARVIDTKKLSEKVSTPVAKRAFANSYDNFVLYGIHKYPHQLCGEFFVHRRNPVWIPKKHLLDRALSDAVKTVVALRRGDNPISCRVGHTGMSTAQLVENIESFVRQFTTHSQGISLNGILHIRVAGTNAQHKRVGLTIYSHTFKSIRRSDGDTDTTEAEPRETTTEESRPSKRRKSEK